MVTIYSKHSSPRLQYVIKLIFSEVLMIDYALIHDWEVFHSVDGKKICYSEEKYDNSLHIKPSGLLEENKIIQKIIKSGQWKNVPVIFANENSPIPFDLFSAVFYLLSRYEEYLPFVADQHGRFESGQSIAVNKNILHLPIVDLWCKLLAEELNITNECKGIHPSNYHFRLTIDVDRAWQYKYAGILHTTFVLLRDMLMLKFNLLKDRLQVLLNHKPDPYFNFKYLKTIQGMLKDKIRYFILCGKPSKYDDNIHTSNKYFRRLINDLFKESHIGIHPSYRSNDSYDLLNEEHANLEKILGQKVFHSRQHYLKIVFPATYRRLIKLGILHDYSMGYSNKSGFRAGIARPYFFYDLSAEKMTDLRIIPFQVMDRTLLSYMKLSPDEAIKEIEYYTETIRNVGGHFVALWHNNSLSDQGEWEGWKEVFEKMISINKSNDQVPAS
jgi:hypothetical protein